MPNPKEIVEGQQKDWNRVAKGWEKWDALIDRNMSFVNFRLVGDARLRSGFRVLDLGSGTGYPAVLAAQAVGETGRVIGQDLADEMLQVARQKAKSLSLSNILFQTGDVTALSFEDRSFDAVISRFCLMFLPEIPKAVGEIARVMKPGAYLSAAVWAAPELNPYLRMALDAAKKFTELPPPDPEQPGIFRLAKAGDLLGMAKQAGLTGISDETLEGVSVFKDPEEFYGSLMDMAAPIQNLIAKFTPDQKAGFEKEFKSLAARYAVGKEIQLPMTIRIVVARKPL
ncbi:MAG TPA: methyltransferase domain-containing protein [Nitrospiria bacterium]|nr:methyltransferase domain-containing protein [Nitrospiria bacterium]